MAEDNATTADPGVTSYRMVPEAKFYMTNINHAFIKQTTSTTAGPTTTTATANTETTTTTPTTTTTTTVTTTVAQNVEQAIGKDYRWLLGDTERLK